MKRLALLFAVGGIVVAVTPELTTWMVNCGGATGYAGYLANVQAVDYEDDDVYVSSTGIPSHTIGPWLPKKPGGTPPPVALPQAHVFQIPRNPVPAATKTETPVGPIGVFVNGVPMFNPWDTIFYTRILPGKTITTPWQQNAVWFEAWSFDSCVGHADGPGVYHYHGVPECLRVELGDTGPDHSPILGWALDGYPVYGPLGYSDALDPSSAVVRLASGWRKRAMADRTTLPDGTVLALLMSGPPISVTAPLGAYIQDFEYAGTGDLDEYNGRDCVTPEYPGGTYAYFVTIGAAGNPAFPYILGLQYYGEPETANFPPDPTLPPPPPPPLEPPSTAAPYDPCVPQNYCTAGTSASGCKATLSAVGQASATAPSGFVVTVTNVESAKDGLFFYGQCGRDQKPWGNGTSLMCIRTPVKRGKLLKGTGIAGLCAGVFSPDLNARWCPTCPKPTHAPIPWQEMQIQFWYRDPFNTSNQNTSLSDALAVFVGP